MIVVGEQYRITQENPMGGASYGTTGDIVEVIEILTDGEVLFRFVSINEQESKRLNLRRQYCEENHHYYIMDDYLENVILDYEQDQTADDNEDLL